MNRVTVVQGDITTLSVDAIVNAANSSLMGGGGVDGAIHRAGGNEILEACKQIRAACGECPPGQAVITTAGKLKARWVIHTVGPIWRGGDNREDETLRSAYWNTLALASKNDVKTIAFPNIGTGVYGFPKGRAATIATETVREYLEKHHDITSVTFCCFDEENYRVYNSILE